MAGHAHHFLQRLDRLSLPQVELALSLYNDEPMLRFILDEERIPARVERTAICLGDADKGPHLIVSRAGKFITALAEGMKPYDTHVVSRAALDSLAKRLANLRERLRKSEQMSAGEGHMGAILKKIVHAGPRFSREDFQSIAGLHPFLRRAFFFGMIDCGKTCLEMRERLIRLRHLPRSLRDEQLKLGWDVWWSLNHFTVLCGIDDGWDPYVEFAEAMTFQEGPPLTLSWAHTRMGVFASVIRAAWLSGRMARTNFDGYAAQYTSAQTTPLVFNSGFGLMAMGARTPSLRPEVAEILAPGPPPEEGGHAFYIHGLKGLVAQTFDAKAEESEALVLALARANFDRLSRALTVEGPQHGPEGAPASLALAAYSQSLFDCLNDPDAMGVAAVAVGPYARREPEDFFLPRAHFDLVMPRWHPKLGEALFAPLYTYDKSMRAPVRVAPSLGRNDACACGSGKKYKRCCLGAKPA